MKIWALADLHLSFSKPEKTMEIFGGPWVNYQEKIHNYWQQSIQKEDIVLLPGDISWAMKLEEAAIDLEWIHGLPGKKILLKGNHDYWWPSSEKLRQSLPPSIDFVYNSSLNLENFSVGGTRLWDTLEYGFASLYPDKPLKKISDEKKIENEKIFEKELKRLRLSLQQMDPKAPLKIAMTHYPPIGLDHSSSKTTAILEEFDIDICVFGHLHGLSYQQTLFKKVRGIEYKLCSCDYLNCQPLCIA